MRMRHVALLALAIVLIAASVTFGARAAPKHLTEKGESAGHSAPFAPHAHASTAQAGTRTRERLPVAIDGAKEPNRIPDVVAYRLFLSVAALPANASPEKIRGRDALVNRIGFSSEDKAAFVKSLGDFREELESKTEQRKRLTTGFDPARRAELAALKAQEHDMFANLRSHVERTLSPDGVARMQAHIDDHVKRRVKIFGTPRQ